MDTELRYGGGTGAESTKRNRRIETNAKRPSLVWNAAATMQQLLHRHVHTILDLYQCDPCVGPT